MTISGDAAVVNAEGSHTLPHTEDALQLRTARAAAMAAVSFEPSARSLVQYESRGCLLVFGDPERVRQAAERLGAGLKIVAFAPAEPPAAVIPSHMLRWIKARLVGVDGRLGRFSALAAGTDGSVDIGRFSFNQDQYFDLVLDLGPAPLMKREVLPPGYYYPGDDVAAFERLLEELPAKVGIIPKPRFFSYDAERCAHGARGLTGCERCLAVCPAEAIHPTSGRGDRIEVDPHLCQGCGTCTLVCPNGAISYDFPSRDRTLARLAECIGVYRERSGGVAPLLLIHEGKEHEAAEELDGRIVPFSVHSVGSVGIELWLAALVQGAAAVTVIQGQTTPPSTLLALAKQIALARQILEGLGESGQRIALVHSPQDVTAPEAIEPPGFESPSTAFQTGLDKRRLLLDALDRLGSQSDGNSEIVSLPDGAPLGTVKIDKDKCTLCMACANLCPAAALTGENNERLYFREANCVQCGLCVVGCPEQAVRLVPRFLVSQAARKEPRLVNQTELARCIECGTPFTSQALLRATTARIKDHPMFQGDGLKLLHMCNTCRMQANVRRGSI
jgi:ferredoxin